MSRHNRSVSPISWRHANDGLEVTLLIFRTGTENTAHRGTDFLLRDLTGTLSQQIDVPAGGRRVEYTDEFGDGPGSPPSRPQHLSLRR